MFSRSSNKFTPKQFPGFHCVGWVKQAHGIRGELFVQLYARKADWLSDLNNINLLAPTENSLKSWEIEVCRPHKEGLILKVRGVDDRNTSETMRKSGVYIPEELLKAEEGDGIYLKQVLGFSVVDPQGTVLGKITGFGTNGVQDLLHVQTEKGVEALIPFVEAFLINIDFDKQQVKMDLPQGLIDLEAK